MVPGTAGVHRIELTLATDPGGQGDVDLAIDYLDVLEIGDLNGDGCINVTDLLSLLSKWGPCSECPADLDQDGTVGVSDLLILLGNWHGC